LRLIEEQTRGMIKKKVLNHQVVKIPFALFTEILSIKEKEN